MDCSLPGSSEGWKHPQMHRQQCKAIRNMKGKETRTPTKERDFPVTSPKEMEIWEWPKKESKRIMLGSSARFRRTQFNEFRKTIHEQIKSSPNRQIIFKKKCVLVAHWLFPTPWTVAHQVSLSVEFSRQEYWSGLPFHFPGDLPDPGIESASPILQADSLPPEP